MKNFLTLYKVNSDGTKSFYENFNFEYEITPEKIWNILLKEINAIINIGNHIYGITLCDILKFYIGGKSDDKIGYEMELYYEPTMITMVAYNSVNKEQGIDCFRKSYIFDQKKNEGNCIDDFINRGVEPLLNNINELKAQIINRRQDRISAIEYHNTFCYEKDFAQISLIKKIAEKLVENCDKHLERISEFYTEIRHE